MDTSRYTLCWTLCVCLWAGTTNQMKMTVCDYKGTVYGYETTLIDEETNITLKEYSGKVLLVVNVASFSSYTSRDYHGLNEVVQIFKPHFDILGFPCNQFGKQEPGRNEEILNTIKYVRPGEGYTPNFNLSQKVDVNGYTTEPLFEFLKNACPATSDVIGPPSAYFYSPIKGSDVTWNFEKFLVDHKGRPRYRYHPETPVTELKPVIKYLIKQLKEENEEKTTLLRRNKVSGSSRLYRG